MNKQFPPEFKAILRDPSVKKAWVNEIESTIDSCQNCGGLGGFILFTALEGPYPQPASPQAMYRLPVNYGRMREISKINRSEVINNHVMWWVGRSHGFNCPVCQGSGLPAKSVAVQNQLVSV
jgi:hypothetical protein